jgi:5-methylcytosine-specific restriction enzyme B
VNPIHRLARIPGRIHAALERKGQVILYGPPGTGKTYWAELAAREILSASEYGKPYSELDPQSQETIHGNGNNSGQIRLCCFHPAYGYDDFIEGYRPQTNNGQLSFVRENGIFKRLCEDAEKAKEKHFIL